ncbi:MAG: DUF2085 domain-containing protein [Myxococcales bacterium]
MSWSFVLSHHTGSGLSRCFRVGSLRLCARCSGLWPALLVGMEAQRLWRWRPGRWDLAVELGLILPALWDYARSHGNPAVGSNLGRALTGLLLGLGLARAAVLGRVAGYGTAGFLFPILLCSSWVLLAPRFWPDSFEAPSN